MEPRHPGGHGWSLAVGAAVLAGAAAAAAGCADPAPAGTTWYRDVAPVVARRCAGCHRDGGAAPFSLERHDLAAPLATRMLDAIDSGLMPPFDAAPVPGCAPTRPWRDDPRPTADEVDLLRAWIADGVPAGDVAEVPPPPTVDLDGVTHAITASVGHVTRGDADEFMCYLLDPAIWSDRWLTGFQVVPGNPKVVHHATVMAVRPGSVLARTTVEAAAVQIGVPFPCGAGDVVVADTYPIGVWTPGTQPFSLDPSLGVPFPAGTTVLVQVHYHPGGALDNAPDLPTVRLRLTTATPARAVGLLGWGNAAAAPSLLPGPGDTSAPEFRIPASAAEHVEAMRFTVAGLPAGRFGLIMAYPHMHYLGTALTARVVRGGAPDGGGGEPADECLVSVPSWDFDWQRTYAYDAPLDRLPTISNGDVLEVTCTYDNTLDNPGVRRALAERGAVEPVDVWLGETTLDEMCLAMFGVSAPVQ